MLLVIPLLPAQAKPPSRTAETLEVPSSIRFLANESICEVGRWYGDQATGVWPTPSLVSSPDSLDRCCSAGLLTFTEEVFERFKPSVMNIWHMNFDETTLLDHGECTPCRETLSRKYVMNCQSTLVLGGGKVT
jgi:hypothetical protein